MKSSINKFFALGAALLLAFTFGACCLKIPFLNAVISTKGNTNLLTYALTVVLFCFSFIIFYALAVHLPFRQHTSCFPVRILTVGLFTLAHVVFIYAMYRMELQVFDCHAYNYIWHKLPFVIVFVILTLELLFFFICIRTASSPLPDYAMYPVYGILTLLVGYNFYTPAVFLGNTSDRLHIDAYFNSIYNILHGNPYTEYTTSIYGHYAIFYKLPLKILGGDFIDFILLNLCISALCFLAVFLALHFVVKNNLIRLLGCIAFVFPVLAMRTGIYWQLWPHRILFMCLMLCFGAFCIRFRKLNAITCILGYLLAMSGILWNTETGLFCAVAWAGFWILKNLCSTPFHPGKMLFNGVLHLFGIIFSFLGAYGVVNIYNLLHGGTVNSMKEFLFPLLQSSYMTDLLRVDLPDFPSAYMIILALLFTAIGWGLSYIKLFCKYETSTNILLPCFAFFTAVLSLGQITYFVNRAAYHNLEICHLPAILLLAIFAEQGIDIIYQFQWKNRHSFSITKLLKGSYAAIALSVLLIVATGTVIQSGQTLSNRQQFRNKQDLHNFAAHIGANIPENTYAFGIGVPELYAMLRWDTQCYTLDFADLSLRPQVGDHVMDEIRQKKIPGFLSGEYTIEQLVKYCSKEKSQWILDHYEISQEFEFQGAVLHYYTLKQ